MLNKKNSMRKEYLKNGDLKMQSTPAGVGQFAVYFVYGLHMEARVYWLHVYGNNVLAYLRDGCQVHEQPCCWSLNRAQQGGIVLMTC